MVILKKKKTFFILLLFVLVVCAIAYFLFGRSNEEVPHFVSPDEFAEKWNGQQELPQGDKSVDVEVPGFARLVFTSGSKEQKVNFFNPEENENFLFKFTLYADGKELWESGYCEPGNGYYDIELSEELPTGKYKGVLLTEIFTPDGKALNSAQIEHLLIVKE